MPFSGRAEARFETRDRIARRITSPAAPCAEKKEGGKFACHLIHKSGSGASSGRRAAAGGGRRGTGSRDVFSWRDLGGVIRASAAEIGSPD